MANVPDDLLDAALALQPWLRGKPDAATEALRGLINAEAWRQGKPEPSGALHKLALTQGTLLASEFDLATHGHAGFRVDVMTVDPRELIRVNQALGFPGGDAALEQTVRTLKTVAPRGRVVRIHSDAFAVVLPPSSETLADEALRAAARDRLERELNDRLRAFGEPFDPVRFTLGLLSLTIIAPTNPLLLGPLVWAEAERAHVAERRSPQGVQKRSLDLHGAV